MAAQWKKQTVTIVDQSLGNAQVGPGQQAAAVLLLADDSAQAAHGLPKTKPNCHTVARSEIRLE